MINEYPYTDFNEYNMDWIIKTVKDLTVEWLQMKVDWQGMQHNFDDLGHDFDDLKNYVMNYFNNLDLTTEVQNILDQMAMGGDFNLIISSTVSDWLDANISPTTPAIDASLTVSGAGADAEVTGLKFAELDPNVKEVIAPMSLTGGTHQGITYTRTGYHTWTVSGISAVNNTSFYNLYTQSLTPDFDPRSFYVKLSQDLPAHLTLALFYMNNGSIVYSYYISKSSMIASYDGPFDAYIIRLNVDSGGHTITSTTFDLQILTGPPDDYFLYPKYVDPSYTAFGDFKAPGVYFTSGSNTYSDKPFYYATLLTTEETGPYYPSSVRFLKQTAECPTGNKKVSFKRFANIGGTFSNDWVVTDYGNILFPSESGADQTSELAAKLSTYKTVYLLDGQYIINNLSMPDDSAIIGVGRSSVLYMDALSGYCLRVNDHCSVQNLSIIGNDVDYVLNDLTSEGTKVGIAWYGNYSDNNNPDLQPHKGIINNVWVSRFNGSGIRLNNTGMNTATNLIVSNTYIWNCYKGLNVAYYSEFAKFTNVDSKYNVIGCVNDGGNNVFVNCDFTANITGFIMDNSGNDKPNNSHGSAIGCIFNHADSNNGYGIIARNQAYGFIFSGCQIFYAKTEITDSDGIVFSNCNYGSSNCDIEIDGGGLVMYTGDVFGAAPTITVTNNTTVVFNSCYTKAGVAVTHP